MGTMKKCFKCGIDKELSEYYRHPMMADGFINKCKECNKKDVRLNYSANKEKYSLYDKKRQRHDKTRIFNHRFTQLKQRVEGRAIRTYLVEGKRMLSYEEYCKWVVANINKFDELYNNWVDSGFDRKLTPSIDRIDNSKGYTADNMQWLTLSNNSKKFKS